MDIRRPTWSDTVQGDPFRGILLSALAVVLLFLSPTARGLPDWLQLDPSFSLVAFTLAFQRIRQAAALEAAIVTAWDTVVRSERDRRTDELLDGPYLLGSYLLPLASVSPIPFATVWLVVELSAVGHLQLFLRSYARFRAGRGYEDTRQDDLSGLLRWRRRQALARIALLVGLLTHLLVSAQTSQRSDLVDAGTWLALVAMAVLLFVVDPLRSPLYRPSPDAALTVSEHTAADGLDRADQRRLEAILTTSLDTGGVTAASLLERTGHDHQGHHLLVARLDDDPVGLLTYQVRDEVGYVWWLVTDPHLRRRGISAALVEHAAGDLDRCDLVVIESDVTTASPGARAGRLAMLRLLHARRLIGVRWRSASANAWYSIFVVEQHGEVGDYRLRAALCDAARFSLRTEPEALADALATIADADLGRTLVP